MDIGEPVSPLNPPPVIEHCYDFPLLVLHQTGGSCPRYNGGICHPLPTPVQPYTEEEAIAVILYADAIENGIYGVRFQASGSTILPGEEGEA
jgi:hypothetical protein